VSCRSAAGTALDVAMREVQGANDSIGAELRTLIDKA
jgi:hypothetical protein